mgnify:CR=1 FL=1
MPTLDPIKRAAQSRAYHGRPEVKARNNLLARERYAAGGKEAKKAYDEVRRKDPAQKVIRSEYQKKRRIMKWPLVKLGELRHRARAKGIPFDLDTGDLILPAVCPVFGTPLKLGEGKMTNDSPSVDRIDNSKGYVKGNVVVVSNRANTMKKAASIAELRRLADFYERLFVIEKTNPPKPQQE